MSVLKRALQDIGNHRFLNAVTVITIALSVLIVSTLVLFFVNAGAFMDTWKQGLRTMAYLEPGLSEKAIRALQQDIGRMARVKTVRYISKEEALTQLKAQMPGQASLFDTLDQNPLPDAFEIEVTGDFEAMAELDAVASRIEGLPAVESVEYGRQWVERFINLFNLFRMVAYGMGGLFFMAAVFIVANTIRLVLYARIEEVEILRLVGATDSFIHAPFYVQGLIQGALGAGIGLLALLAVFSTAASDAGAGLLGVMFKLRFLTPPMWLAVIAGSMFVGWLGCFLSLKQSINAAGSDRRR